MHKPILVIIGPSGVGKSTLAGELLNSPQKQFELIPKYTTRPQRQVEKHTFSEDIFVTPEKFEKLVEQNFFVGTLKPFGLPYVYGVPWPKFDNPHYPLVLLRAFALELFKNHFSNVIVYQLEVDPQVAKQRMVKRGQSPDDIAARMKIFNDEIEQGRALASTIFTNDGNLAVLADAITSNFIDDSRCLL